MASHSTSFRQLAPFTPRVVSINYVSFPLDNPSVIFGNEPQSFTAECALPGFPAVTVTIPANTYTSFVSQADANAKALAAAELQAESELVCCWSSDPLPDTPDFNALSNEYTVSNSAQYGLQPMEDIKEEVVPYVSLLHNWTLCPTCDFCNGPDEEAITQTDPYSLRWFVRFSGGQFVYGKDGLTENPVPSDLMTGINQSDVINMSISFDSNARPVFAFQIAAGTINVRRYVAGTPTFVTFAGDTPRLFFDGIIQRDLASTDVVCIYVRAGEIKTRFQRDLFGTEYTFLAPSPAALKVTKTDINGYYQYLYFQDVNEDYWLGRSEVYQPFPTRYTDRLTSTVTPQGGTYTSPVIPGGSYSDALTSTVSPSDGTYFLASVAGGSYSDALTSEVAPEGGSYTLVIVAGGSYSDSLTSTVSPSTGTYTLISTPGGSYTDSLNSTVAPSGGSYA